MREWPASERCFARESCSRRKPITEVAIAATPSPENAKAVPLISIESDVDESRYGTMTLQSHIFRLAAQEDLNFLLTNRIPRRLATQFIGWFSKLEQPLVRDLSIAAWRFFSGLDLSEAKKTRFRSMHDCFTRELRDGARPIARDPQIVASPCDAIVGACGAVEGTRLYQIKGFPYALDDLLCDRELTAAHRDARYVTLRLTSAMYHRFHAPHDCRVSQVNYI